jgi:hypothetical protein
MDPAPPQTHPLVNKSFLLKALLGSALLGGTVGLTNSIFKRRKDIMTDDDDDGFDVAPLTKRASPVGNVVGALGEATAWAADKFNQAAPGLQTPKPEGGREGLDGLDLVLGGAAIPLGFLGGMQGARGIEQWWKHRDLKEKLKNNQAAYDAALQAEAEAHRDKRASTDARPLEFSDLAGLTFAGIPVLTALTAGLLSDRYLSAQFPPLGRTVGADKKFRVAPGASPEDEAETHYKAASDIMLVECALQTHKSAHDTGLRDLVGAVAAGHLDTLEKTVLHGGLDRALDSATGYWDKSASFSRTCKHAAVIELLDSPVLGDTTRALAAAEFAACSPTWRERGAAAGENAKFASRLEGLTGSVALLAIATDAEREFVSTKQASTNGNIPVHLLRDLLQQHMLQRAEVSDAEANTADDNASTLLTSALETQHSDKSDQGDSSIAVRPPKDEIDQILTQGQTTANGSGLAGTTGSESSNSGTD